MGFSRISKPGFLVRQTLRTYAASNGARVFWSELTLGALDAIVCGDDLAISGAVIVQRLTGNSQQAEVVIRFVRAKV